MAQSSWKRIALYFLASGLVLSAWQFDPTRAQTPPAKKAGQRDLSVYDGPMNDVLVKDYQPRSNLVVPEHHPPKAKFPVVDVHVHPSARTPEAVAAMVKAMDETGVETVVLMTGAVGEAFDRLADLYLKPYPNRFILFCGMAVRGQDIEAADFPKKVAAELERCYRAGARGVGEITDKGRGFGSGTYADPDALLPRDKRLHVDDRRLDPFWQKCAELKMPVNIHIADHPSAWQPDDQHQERTPQFQR